MSDIEIEIDGKTCQAKPDAMVIQVADAAGIYIPRFCYHKHLSIAANCRMCLVEVEKSPKPLPACATPVMPGMKVFTRSAKALAAQKAVMEFLLINHPLDCPICDQGGECELQDLSMGYGQADSSYVEGKRSVKDEDLGPLIATEMTRCILCTRCVRFGNEVAGFPELGVTFRGEQAEIQTYIQHALHSEVSGNIIDLCPVGALTSKPFRFTARAWELNQYPSIAAHDCLGSNINVHTRRGKVMRVVPRENNAINQTWLSDRDRFAYQGLNHADRLEKPLIRVEDKWQEVDWQVAIEFAVGKLQKVLSAHGVEQLGALASTSSTLEEYYLLQKLTRALGSENIDHRLRQVDFDDQDLVPLFPGVEEVYTELSDADAIVLIGSNIQKEQPLAALRIRNAVKKGASVIAINMLDYRFNFKVTDKIISAPDELPMALAHIAVALGAELEGVKSDTDAKTIAANLKDKKNIKILLGADAINHPQAAVIRQLAAMIANSTSAKIGFLTEGANTSGAWIAGMLPHHQAGGVKVKNPGLDAQAMLAAKLKAYLLLNIEPDTDAANPVLFTKALQQAECVIALSTFDNPTLRQFAHVILPITPYTETSGTFVNAMGGWQTFTGAAPALGDARPGWKVLRVLGNWLQLPDFDYESSLQILDFLTGLQASNPLSRLRERGRGEGLSDPLSRLREKNRGEGLIRIGTIPAYSIDGITRRAKALQATQAIVEGELVAVRLHPETAKRLQLAEGEIAVVTQQDYALRLPVVLDERVPLRGALIAGGLREMRELSELFGVVHINGTNTINS